MTVDLNEFLTWIIGGGGAGALAYWLMERVPALRDLSSEWKRYISLALAGLLSAGAFAASVGLGYVANPGDWQGWIESIFAVVAVGVGLSQIIHGRLKLRGD